VLDQNTSLQNSVATTTTVNNWAGTEVTHENFSFPITVNFTYPVSSSPFGFRVATGQKYHTDKQIAFDGFRFYFDSLTNTVNATDVSPALSSQKYSYQIASRNNTLTKVSPGCTPDKH